MGAAPRISSIFHGRGAVHSCITENFLILQEALRRISQFRAFCKNVLFLCQVFFLQFLEIRIFARSLSSKTRRYSTARQMQCRVTRCRAFPAYFMGAAPCISCIIENFLILQEALRRISQFRAFCKNDLFLCQVFFLPFLEIRIFARSLSSKTR